MCYCTQCAKMAFDVVANGDQSNFQVKYGIPLACTSDSDKRRLEKMLKD